MPYTPMTGLMLPDDAAIVWRYMDLWKFESMLKSSGLYFVRSDRFCDPCDSILPPKWREKMQRVMCDRLNGGEYTEVAWYEERETPTNAILCWNCDENENERMWREYTEVPDSLSGIRTLIESIHVHPNATIIQQKQVKSLLDQYGYCDIPAQSSNFR